MGNLKKQYEAYQTKLLELEKAYQVLTGKQIPVNQFLNEDMKLFEERVDLRLASIPIGEKLDSLKKKHMGLESEKYSLEADHKKFVDETNSLVVKVQTLEISEEEKSKLIKRIDELKEKISRTTESLTQTDMKIAQSVASITQQEGVAEANNQEIAAIEEKISWAKNRLFSSQYIQNKGITQGDFNSYTDAMANVVKLRNELQGIQARLPALLKARIDPTKLKNSYHAGEEEALRAAWALEKTETMKWSKDNVFPISMRVTSIGEKVTNNYHSALHEAHENAAANHLKILGKEKYHHKFVSREWHLNDLEKLVEERVAKQNAFRSLLPLYASAEIPQDVQIKGQRTFGLGKTDTSNKVQAIQTYLETPFGNKTKLEVTNKIKELFSKVNVGLSNDAVNRVYEGAVREQAIKAQKDAPMEHPKIQL